MLESKVFRPLKICGGNYDATFDVDGRLRCSELRRNGVNFLAAEGVPFIAPWFGRLAAPYYEFDNMAVELHGRGHVDYDAEGLPLHGVNVQRWEVVSIESDRLVMRCNGYDRDVFPFAHIIEVEITIGSEGLSVQTVLLAGNKSRVPVGFGWHPYFRVEFAETISGSFGERYEMRKGIPTGLRISSEESFLPSVPRDELWKVSNNGEYVLRGKLESIKLRVLEGFGFVVVWVPADISYVCVEPIVAKPNMFADPNTPVVEPGKSFYTRFLIA